MVTRQLSGKTIAITGASRGIGKETARQLQAAGANIIVGGRNEKDLLDLANASDVQGGAVLPVPLDVTDESSVQHFVDVSLEHFGKIDALVNCAGVGTFCDLLDSATEDFDQMVNVNLRGTYLTCKYVGRHMVERGSGHILNIVSIAGTTALPGCGGYSASKFGVLGLTRVLQAELRTKGVHVTAVLPGAVSSSFWDSIDPKPDLSSMIPVSVLAHHLVYILSQPAGGVIDEITIMPPLGIL
jgi:3-oxoacyl-[acyl-carrier protein] reductase